MKKVLLNKMRCLFIATLINITIISCSFFRDNRYRVYAPDDLIVKRQESSSAKTIAEQRKEDLQFLLYGLKNAYVGRVVYGEDQWQAFLKKLDSLSQNKFDNNNSFCEAIDSVLDTLPDYHLKTNRCGVRKKIKPTIGTNLAGEKVWKILRTPDNIGLIGISSFPSEKEKLWNGFIDSFKKIEKTKAIVVDLRGNGGGDDSMGRALARFILGQDLPPMVLEKITSKTPETFAMYLNNVLSEIEYLKKNGNAVPAYLSDEQRDWEQELDIAKKGKYPAIEIKNYSSRLVDKKMIHYNKTIYVLADQGCGSSCESTIDALRSHPRFILAGQNTKGQHAFGNVLPITLPNSKIEILLASHHWKFIDTANIEKIGFSPRIPIQNNEDALEHVLKLINTI